MYIKEKKIMTTTSLDLSRQLQELWPEWGKESAEYVYYINGGEYSGQVYYKEMVFNKDGNLPARTLDELRVFALELIEKESGVKIDESKRVPGVLYGLHDRYVELKDALIQGCDPTAEFILNTFGGK